MSKSQNPMERYITLGLGLIILGVFAAFAFQEHGHNQLLRKNLKGLLEKYHVATNDRAQLKSQMDLISGRFFQLQNDYLEATNDLSALRIQIGDNTDPSGLPVFGIIPNFKLTNQTGDIVTDTDMHGSVWLADIIFTRCAGPCPIMSQKMADMQNSIPNDWPVKFVTLTTDPKFDTPEVLNRYAKRFNADNNRWHFLTGPMKEISKLAMDGLKLTALPKAASDQTDPNDLFIHATIFVLVDSNGRTRAVFESDDENVSSKIRAAIGKLLQKEGS